MVSIIIPVRNGAATLAKTLDSLRQQTCREFEIIVVDDHSSDGSLGIAKRYPVRVIENKAKPGVATARNLGIGAARYDLIAFIDADCTAENDWLEALLDEYRKHADPAISGRVRIPSSTILGDCISALGFPAGANAGFENMWHVSPAGYTTKLATPNALIEKSVFTRLGLFDDTNPYGAEDTEFSFRLVKNSVKIKYCPRAVVWHVPRNELKSFVRWHFYRGQGNYYLKKKIVNVGGHIRLRLWSTKNILKQNLLSPKIFLILPLLVLSFVLQQYGYLEAKQNDPSPKKN